MTLRTAVIGAGAPPDHDDPGYAIGYAHGRAYRAHDVCDLLAVADHVDRHAAAYAEEFDVASEHAYADSRAMLGAVDPDVVSVCTPPESHAGIVVDCARAGVDAIHCEKPMATTWDDCRRMAGECARRDVQLTINHQRRFAPRWRVAAERVHEGVIGDVRRVEMTAPDLLDWGTHCFDLCGFYAGDRPAEWALGTVGEAIPDFYDGAYDHHVESAALARWEYANGVHGLATTGEAAGALGSEVFHRVVGTEGVVEVDIDGGPRLRRRDEAGWTDLEYGESDAFRGAVDDVVRGLETGAEPELSARNALNATELVYATWESARRRGRVDLPLRIGDNPLEAMITAGELPVRGR